LIDKLNHLLGSRGNQLNGNIFRVKCMLGLIGDLMMVCTLMKQLNTFYKYYIKVKQSNIYNIYKMCTDNNDKIRLSQP